MYEVANALKYMCNTTREFSRKVQELIRKLPGDEKYGLASQMRKAKLSVMNT